MFRDKCRKFGFSRKNFVFLGFSRQKCYNLGFLQGKCCHLFVIKAQSWSLSLQPFDGFEMVWFIKPCHVCVVKMPGLTFGFSKNLSSQPNSEKSLRRKSQMKVSDENLFLFFIGQVLDLSTTGNHTQNITCTIRLDIALSCSSWVATTAVFFENKHFYGIVRILYLPNLDLHWSSWVCSSSSASTLRGGAVSQAFCTPDA